MPREVQKTSVIDAAKSEHASSFLRSRDYLKAIFTMVKEHRKSYSYRQFAQDLGFGFTNYMHLIITGQRPLSSKAVSQVADNLHLKGDERRYLELLVRSENAKTPNEREEIFAQLVELKHRMLPPDLESDMLDYLSEWYHPVVREMATLANFQDDPAWISAHIFPPISQAEASASLELLRRIGFLVTDDETGKVTAKEVNIRTGSVVRGLSVRRYHQTMMELAREALVKVPAGEREFQAITIAASPSFMVEIKDEVGRFWRWLLERSQECGEADRVVQVNIQAFPTTRLPEKKS